MRFLKLILVAALSLPGAGAALTAQEASALFEKARGGDADAVQAIRKAAESGSAQGQYQLFRLYSWGGPGLKPDEKEGATWVRRAAEQGHAEAQTNLGYVYMSGRGLARDEAEGARWYEKAASQGFAPACFNLSIVYERGQGVARDPAKAVHWLRCAADAGIANAQVGLGARYMRGDGVPVSPPEAHRLFKAAAEAGNDRGQYNLGLQLETGNGVAQDRDAALAWYAKSSRQGNFGAMSKVRSFCKAGSPGCQQLLQPLPASQEPRAVAVGLPEKKWRLEIGGQRWKMEQDRTSDNRLGRRILAVAGEEMVMSASLQTVPRSVSVEECAAVMWEGISKAPVERADVSWASNGEMWWVEYTIPSVRGVPIAQRNIYTFLVREDVCMWVHLSRVRYRAEDRPLFDRALGSLRISEN